MALIRSISGIRGTIGGRVGAGLNPLDLVKYTAAYASLICKNYKGPRIKVVVGRDARISGEMLDYLVTGTLLSMSVDVINLDLSTTPTVEMAVTHFGAQGGIILTASHNPKEWNALKFLNSQGEFISAAEGEELLEIAKQEDFLFAGTNHLGKVIRVNDFLDEHIKKIISLSLVDCDAIRKAKLRVAVDAVNSSGGIAVPHLLKALGVKDIVEVNCEPSGDFAHDPEPLPENLETLSEEVIATKSHVGFAVDPDVDRLAIVCEDGEMFGEEYTLVAVADYVLNYKKGSTVSNLSSTRALQEITLKHGQEYFASAVGEVNVVEMMKLKKAIIGGEGNGGVIYPELHYGRDALLGIALFLSHLVKSGMKCSEIKDRLPRFFISKNKISLQPEMNIDKIIQMMRSRYASYPQISIDGLRIDFDQEWVHLRKSNTEPIIRIYSESDSISKAETLARKVIDDIREIVKDL